MQERLRLTNHLPKFILFLFLSLYFCAEVLAEQYRVTANELNVRTLADKHSEVLGKLSQGNVIEVISIENGWAKINYNGWQGYVSESYIESAEKKAGISVSTGKQSWDLTSWLFDSEGEATWFTVLKWIVIIGVAIYFIKVIFQIAAMMIFVGLAVGGIGLAAGFILNWLGWIESDTMWSMAQWGFRIGNGIGLVFGIFNFKDVHEEATKSWSSSSSSSNSNNGGLKTDQFTDDGGTVHYLTQDSPYSECNYTDQFGNKYSKDSQGFHLR